MSGLKLRICDFTRIEGSYCYCSPECVAAIRAEFDGMAREEDASRVGLAATGGGAAKAEAGAGGIGGGAWASAKAGAENTRACGGAEPGAWPEGTVHLIGTGDYHYVSLLLQERLRRPYSLLLFDNHSDDHAGAFDADILSCGNWVRDARRLPMLQDELWIREPMDSTALLDVRGAIYVSIDLDVLASEYAETDWDQGSLTLPCLCGMVEAVARSGRLVAADICGGLKDRLPEVNRRAVKAILDSLGTLQRGRRLP